MATTPKPSPLQRLRAALATVLAGTVVAAALGCGQTGALMGAERNAAAKAAKNANGFLWGVATAGHQWEGGDRHSNWAKWVSGPNVMDPNPAGVMGYTMYEQDMDLARGMGCNSFRLSLEWSRIEPVKGQIDWAEVAHYHRVLDALHARGMTPVVTLMHFAYPAWLDAEGGWENGKAVEAYKRHAAFVAKEFGSKIEWYLTFNEPNMLLLCGYGNGTFPPGKKMALWAAAKVGMNLVKGHKAAYEAVHANDPKAKVSFNMYAAEYKIGKQPGLEAAAEGGAQPGGQDDMFLAGAMGEDEGRGGKKYMDYVSFDYYSRNWMSLPVSVVEHDQWEVYPEGFYKAIKRYHARTGLPVLIAENGMATYDLKPRKDGWTRGAYLAAHVKEMQRAMREGVPVVGYIHWSISDNYEWGTYKPRFGLYSVEAKAGDFRRTPTDGVDAYRRVIASNGWTPEIGARYAPPMATFAAKR
jgi:beta-glucosidase